MRTLLSRFAIQCFIISLCLYRLTRGSGSARPLIDPRGLVACVAAGKPARPSPPGARPGRRRLAAVRGKSVPSPSSRREQVRVSEKERKRKRVRTVESDPWPWICCCHRGLLPELLSRSLSWNSSTCPPGGRLQPSLFKVQVYNFPLLTNISCFFQFLNLNDNDVDHECWCNY